MGVRLPGCGAAESVGGLRRGVIVVVMPARPHDSPAGLPPAGGSFVGRERELDRTRALLMGPARLVTLIGAGGIGKTRLAEEAGRRLHKARRTRVFCVRLARLAAGADRAAVQEAVAESVLLSGFAGASAWDGVMATLGGGDESGPPIDPLLLLDNCEHVLAAVAAVVGDLLDAVPGLTVLATSREPVGWVDEQLVAVEPLTIEQSLELFAQRAELTGHPISEPHQLRLARAICGRMHGNPLFIRLAAARTFYEPLSMIYEQLDGESDDARMRWRHGPRLGVDDRHRSITDVIAWSYELCEDKQRLLFDRLSVFAPGYDVNPEEPGMGQPDVGAELEAIEVVCADDVAIEGGEDSLDGVCADRSHSGLWLGRSEIRGLLDGLVEKSLVSIHISGDAVRYSLLESLRLFAEGRLAARSTEAVDEPARLARRHCYYYRYKVLQAQVQFFGPAELELLTWGVGAWPNIRRAIDTSLRTAGQAVVGLQIAFGALALRGPLLSGSLPELRGRIEQTLAAARTSPRRQHGQELIAMALLAWLAVVQGRPDEAEQLLERCVAASDMTAVEGGHWRDRPEIDIGLPPAVDYAWGAELMFARRDPRAIVVLARAREKLRRIGHPAGEAMCELLEAMAAAFYGSPQQAVITARRYFERTTAAGARYSRVVAHFILAIALTKHGEVGEALQLGRAALAYQLPLGDQWGMMWSVHLRMWSLARLLSDQLAAPNTLRRTTTKLATEIAYLAGGLTTQRARLGVLIENMGPFAEETSTAEMLARQLLGPESYSDAEKRGARLFLEPFELQRIAQGTFSIDSSCPDQSPSPGVSGWETLSKAEQEVAILAAAGWSNSGIGVRRGTSSRTTDAHISAIFQKLMINSRSDIMDFIPLDQRGRVALERNTISSHDRNKPRSFRPRP